MSMLNRWTAQKRDLERSKGFDAKATYMGGAMPNAPTFGPYAAKKRPKIASEVDSVKECEFWRSEILRGCAKKIAEIQNAALGEHRVRDLNDEINKDLREKNYWEDQIKALGGPDHKAMAPKETESYGAELASHSGYKYFGAAKDLPGVRELFEAEVVPEAPRKSRKQLFKNIQPDYYGWRDEEDGMLLLAEQEFEHERVQKAMATWKAENADKPKTKKAKVASEAVAQQNLAAEEAARPAEKKEVGKASGMDFKAYVDVPSMEEISQLILAKKKEHLLKKYASPAMQKAASESVALQTPAEKPEATGSPDADAE